VPPDLPGTDTVEGQQHGQPGGSGEPGDGDVQVADVVVEAGAELLDLVLADIDLLGPDAEFQEAVGEVADQDSPA
jgi:hypothetical protein